MGLMGLGLAGVLLAVLVLPFSVRHVEEELEAFLLLMGAVAVTMTGQWSASLAHAALLDPLPLALAVLAAGALFHALRAQVAAWVQALRAWVGTAAAGAMLVLGLGLLSAGITALVAALVLAQALQALRLPRAIEVRLAVLACFSIGLGSALTPLGGPLAAIVVSRLAGPPYQAGLGFMAGLVGPWAAGLMLVVTGLAWRGLQGIHGHGAEHGDPEPPTWAAVGLRAFKAYLFVLGLVLLGQGFAPLAERWLPSMPGWALFWANSSSAVLDNATLVAAEVGPGVPQVKLLWLLMGLLISGGMLVPGNIPNILCAGQRRIRAKEWAKVGVPVGLGLMVLTNALLWLWG